MNPHEVVRTAHDLNNVLQVLSFRNDQLLASLEDWDPLYAALKGMQSEIRKATNLVRQMVGESESDDNNLVPSPAPGRVSQATPAPANAPMRKKDPSSKKQTLLYVDDQLERLTLLKSVLESTGYEVLTAESGLKGLELFMTEPIDLVVLDYYMPSMDGGAVATKMRRLRPNVPIIIFSGALTLPELVIAMVDGFISTSEEPELLLEKISDLLNSVQAQAS
jgi:CheY-like chemotaxis protein